MSCPDRLTGTLADADAYRRRPPKRACPRTSPMYACPASAPPLHSPASFWSSLKSDRLTISGPLLDSGYGNASPSATGVPGDKEKPR